MLSLGLTRCSASSGDPNGGVESGDGTGNADGIGPDGNGDGTGNGTGSGIDIGVGNGMPESCDGVDNDENGVVDDVDVGGDGVCDCLRIATLGQIGPWSNGGNIFATWLDERSPLGAVSLGDQVLTDELLDQFQVIVVLHVASQSVVGNGRTVPSNHIYSNNEIAAFERWVMAGGGAMTTIGYSGNEAAEVVNVNSLLAPLGLAYSTSRLELTSFVQRWEPHALTDGVRNIRTDDGVEPAGSGGTVLAWDTTNRIALEVNQAGEGRVVVWGDEWITYDSEWSDVTEQQVERFWLNVLKWLSPAKTCQVQIPIR
jgi:hypothetical protein